MQIIMQTVRKLHIKAPPWPELSREFSKSGHDILSMQPEVNKKNTNKIPEETTHP